MKLSWFRPTIHGLILDHTGWWMTLPPSNPDRTTLEEVVARRYGMPGESFEQTVERLTREKKHA